jgi:hypothetical protein
MTDLKLIPPMTQTKWDAMSPAEKDKVRDLSGLSPQLTGLEGWRVEVLTMNGDIRRFIVGRSTGWRPCHIEVERSNSSGGTAADREYIRVKKLYRTER